MLGLARAIALLLVALLLFPGTAEAAAVADEGGLAGAPAGAAVDEAACDGFEFIQSVIASEAARQPFDAQLAVARAVRDNSLCRYDANYLAGIAVAERAALLGDFFNHHWRAYRQLYSFAPALRERWALASHVALTEEPRVPVRHFGSVHDDAWWWESPRACPHGIQRAGDVKWC